MTLGEVLIACIAAIFGAYQAFLSMFIQRPPAFVWLLSPIVWPISWLLNGTLGRYRLLYLLLCILGLVVNAALYAFLALGLVRFVRQMASRKSVPKGR